MLTFKRFIKSVLTRLGDLIIKNISMKVEAALVITYIQTKDASVYGVTGFVIVTVMWITIIGLRYAEKVAGITEKVMASVRGAASGVISEAEGFIRGSGDRTREE